MNQNILTYFNCIFGELPQKIQIELNKKNLFKTWPEWNSAEMLKNGNQRFILIRRNPTLDYDLIEYDSNIENHQIILQYFSCPLLK